MDERLLRIEQRAGDARMQVVAVKSYDSRRDLAAMLHTVEAIMIKISRESVICRQKKRRTAKYEDLIQQCTESLEMLEKYIVFAKLIGG